MQYKYIIHNIVYKIISHNVIICPILSTISKLDLHPKYSLSMLYIFGVVKYKIHKWKPYLRK